MTPVFLPSTGGLSMGLASRPHRAGTRGAIASRLLTTFDPAAGWAMLSGGAPGGAEVMAGFARGALPSVTTVALGLANFRRLAEVRNARVAVGLAIMALAAPSVAAPLTSLAAQRGAKPQALACAPHGRMWVT